MRSQKTFHTATVIILVFLFTYSGFVKIINFEDSRNAFLNQVFPTEWGKFLSYAVPLSELMLSVLLLYNKKTRRIALPASLVLMTVFSTYTGLVTMEAFDRVPCSCGGAIESLGWTGHLVMNSALVITISLAIISHYNP